MERVLENYNELLKHYSKDQLNELKNWLNNYIVPLKKEEIVWLNLTNDEFQRFLKDNYVDDNNNQVMWCISWLPTILGMQYLNFFNTTGFNYLIGVIPNKLGKKTIVASLCYEKKRIWSLEQEKPVNSIQNIETNSFYQKQGLFNILSTKIIECLDKDLDLVITDEQDDGIEFHTVDRIKKVLNEQGFNNEVLTRSEFVEKNRNK